MNAFLCTCLAFVLFSAHVNGGFSLEQLRGQVPANNQPPTNNNALGDGKNLLERLRSKFAANNVQSSANIGAPVLTSKIQAVPKPENNVNQLFNSIGQGSEGGSSSSLFETLKANFEKSGDKGKNLLEAFKSNFQNDGDGEKGCKGNNGGIDIGKLIQMAQEKLKASNVSLNDAIGMFRTFTSSPECKKVMELFQTSHKIADKSADDLKKKFEAKYGNMMELFKSVRSGKETSESLKKGFTEIIKSIDGLAEKFQKANFNSDDVADAIVACAKSATAEGTVANATFPVANTGIVAPNATVKVAALPPVSNVLVKPVVQPILARPINATKPIA